MVRCPAQYTLHGTLLPCSEVSSCAPHMWVARAKPGEDTGVPNLDWHRIYRRRLCEVETVPTRRADGYIGLRVIRRRATSPVGTQHSKPAVGCRCLVRM
jgi:hypothetical protein